MRFLRRPKANSRCIAIFCGAFHPPTVAHVARAEAALQRVDEVVWVLPERFPHKSYEQVPLAGRVRMLLEATGMGVAIAREKLFFAIAEEASRELPRVEVRLLMGEDGATRIFEWEYGMGEEEKAAYLLKNLARYPLLSARRDAGWDLPQSYAEHVEWLELYQPEVSSSEVRKRIEAGAEWESLVPKQIRERVAKLYGSSGQFRGQ